MKKRTITGACLFICLAPIYFLGGYFMLVLSLLLAYVAGFELIRMFSVKHPGMKKYRYIMPFYSCILVLTNYFVINKMLEFDYKFLVLIITLSILCILIVTLRDSNLDMSCAGLFILAIIYGGLMFGFATSIRYIDHIGDVTGKFIGLWLMIYLTATTCFTDMGAYTVGSLIGRHKMCPNISPNKTIEGAVGGSLIGGIVGTIVLVLVENYYHFSIFGISNKATSIILIFVLTIILTILGQVGDLIASKLKREYDIKDYSNIFPGHGGVMDRFDSTLITGTTLFVVFLYLGIL